VKKYDHFLVPANKRTGQENYLKIASIDSYPRLAGKLPAQLARQYHAIPIAADLARLTIAIADPDDPAAREAIQSAVRLPATLVKADRLEIDSLIKKCYFNSAAPPLQFFVSQPEGQVNPDHQNYIRSFTQLFHADLAWGQKTEGKTNPEPCLSEEIKQLNKDLLICPSASGSFQQHFAPAPDEKKLFKHCNTSILLIRETRWPIQQILLVLQVDDIDACAEEWAVRVAIASKASLTILPVIPTVPLMYSEMQQGLSELLDSNCQLGQHLRRVARRLVNWEVSGSFKLRDEPPEWQIRSEISQGDFDLIIIGVEFHNPLRKLFMQDLVFPLSCWTTRPILLAQAYP